MAKAPPQEETWVPRVRETMKDRARWFAFLYRSYCKYFPPEIVEEATREATRKFGLWKARDDGKKMPLAFWMEKYKAPESSFVFHSQIVKGTDTCEHLINYCPLVEAWKEIGCSKKEIDLFCDIVMEETRGQVEKSGISLQVTSRISKGENHCRLFLKKP